MNNKELFRRYELVTGSDYDEIRQRTLDYIVTTASSALNPEIIRGMLMVIKHIDSWRADYEKALEKTMRRH